MSDQRLLILTWTVPDDHPAFMGHFPGDPLLPATAILDWLDAKARETLGRPLGRGNLQAKFLRPCRPQDSLEATLQPLAEGGLKFEVRVNGELAVSGRAGKSR